MAGARFGDFDGAEYGENGEGCVADELKPFGGDMPDPCAA
jgi:hypothetical protein